MSDFEASVTSNQYQLLRTTKNFIAHSNFKHIIKQNPGSLRGFYFYNLKEDIRTEAESLEATGDFV
ncbi:MAG: hypothetical protein K0S33_1098 [Bacteroidetes bacterium]|jgi:hypothetical protein|nr:hypothetical protein [Bacteroidota bacterium]